MTPHARAIGTRVNMAAVGTQLLVARDARAQGAILASLALLENRQAQMRGKGEPERTIGEEGVRRGSKPS